MNREEIFEELRSVMVRLFKLDSGEIRLGSRLREDLDLDSIDAIDLVVAMQELSKRKVDQDLLQGVRTVADIVMLIDHLGNRRG